MKKFILLIAISLSTLNSCYFAFYPQSGSYNHPVTNPELIKIYSGDIDQDYLIIGPVAADVIGDADDVVKYLKKKASELGADAIIKVDLTKMNSSSISTGISGIAIRLIES